jgi:8-oxo-dGTP pyrophosphatase MutT (NUDIX family)
MTQDDPTREDAGATWEPPKYALGAVVYAERDGEILLLKRAGETAFSGQWYLPGGAVDPGESPQEAAVRELREESGLDVLEEPELVGCYLSRLYGHDFLMLSFRAPVAGDVALSHEHDGVRWVDPLDMRAFMTDETLLELAGGNERTAAGLRRLRDDLDVYIARISKEQRHE